MSPESPSACTAMAACRKQPGNCDKSLMAQNFQSLNPEHRGSLCISEKLAETLGALGAPRGVDQV